MSRSRPFTPPVGAPAIPAQTRPIGFVSPQYFAFLHNQSPTICTKQPGVGSVSRSQSFPFGAQKNPFQANNHSGPTYGIYPPNCNQNQSPCSSKYAFEFTDAFQRQSLSASPEMSHGKNDSKHNSIKYNVELPALKKQSPLGGNLYKNLSEELKCLDLIDLGQDDGKNILEVFDPLFDKPKDEKQPNLQPPLVPLTHPAQKSSAPLPYGLYPQPAPPPSVPAPSIAIIESVPETQEDNVSIASSNYGWKSDVSLYPTLPPASLMMGSECGDHQSILYDAYNQFEYLYAVSSESSSFYWHPKDASPYSVEAPPSPSIQSSDYVPPQSVRLAKLKRSSSENTRRRGKLYEDITSLKKVAQNDGELIAFVDMLQKLKLSVRMARSKQPYSYTKSPTAPSECWLNEGLSLKLKVWNENFTADAVTFTSEVCTPVQVVIVQAITKMDIDGTGEDYLFRVKGLDEYFDSDRLLIEYRYVQECVKFDEDVCLVLVHKSSLAKGTWTRPRVDSAVEVVIQPEEIMPTCDSKVITFAEIAKFLEVIDRESDKLNEKVSEGSSSVNSTPLMQTVKGICVLLGDVQTVEIRRTLQTFCKTCENWNSEVQKLSQGQNPQSNRRTVIGSDASSRHSFVEIIKEEKSSFDVQKDCLLRTKETVIDSVRMLVEMYSKSFPVNFQMNCSMESTGIQESNSGSKIMSEMLDSFLVRISALHRIKSVWSSTYVDFFVAIEVFHGTRLMGKQTSPNAVLTKMDDYLFFNSVIIDSWVDFEHLPICILPRECRLVFSVYGRKLSEVGESHDTVELGWASIQCFNYQGFLIRGNQLLPLWPVGMPQKRLGPAPNSAFSYDLNVPLITIEFPDFGRDLKFPEIPNSVPVPRDFQSLDSNTQMQLKDIIETTTFTKFPAEDREVLWEKRHYLTTFPTALPKVLLSAQFWDFASLSELHKIMDNWSPLSPPEALQLLLPCFPDAKVRQTAIKWISEMSIEDLITVLPQLVEALSYETFDLSPLSEFLLKQSLFSFEIAHSLFWNLVSEIGLGKWGSESELCTMQFSNPCRSVDQTDPRRRRLELMRNSLMTIAYHKWKNALISEFKLMQGLNDVTTLVKLAHPSQRSSVLSQELKRMDIQLFGGHTVYSLPLSPSYVVTSLDVDMCICYNSASVPLKIHFKNALPEGGIIPILFKQGDDIRQDMLTIQVIRMIETWWLKDGLDLRVVTFTCVPTGFKQGVVEIVSNAETLCKIQADYGVTGAFRNRPISEWLAKMNSSTLDYRRAVENFTRSCAAYCVLTYVLGICDRHNDNIMLTTRGHLFHIDFGKFLGDAQMFGSFKRDRAPFVLTTDMLYVINDGEKVSQRFHHFVELCCQAFRVVRKNGDILMNLFAMMATAGIPGVDIKSVAYIQNALLPDCSNVEAAAKFTRFIEDSLRNWFTPVNFFIHSLAQLRFASDTTDNPSTLSFMPKMYNMDCEGRIESAVLVGFQKDYDPEKYYLFSIKVKRKDQNQPSFVHRSYKQFLELYSKLCINFPMAVRSLRALPKKSGIGRSNVKQVAEKRRGLLQAFLESLFSLADEISHSDLVYTFFHPTLKDEEYLTQDDRAIQKENRRLLRPVKIHGSINVCIQYSKGALLVLIKHAYDLACPNGQPPSAYVKSYLQPDPLRLTKRKTRIMKRSQHPTFMEMIEYRLPLNVVLKRTLQLSVWHQETLQENTFLGGVSIPLTSIVLENETTDTFILGNLPIAQ